MDINRNRSFSISITDGTGTHTLMEYEELKNRLVFEKASVAFPQEPPKVKEIIFEPHPCEDCDKIIDGNRQITYSRLKQPYLHWQEYCNVCKQYKNPITGEFNCSNRQKRAIMNQLNAKRTK